MKIEAVPIEDLEPFIEFKQKEREMQVRLTKHQKEQERFLEEMKGIKQLATAMKRIQEKYKFKTDKEMMKVIRRHAIN